MRTDAPQGTAPRVVLDIKMLHPDVGDNLAAPIGIYTNLPFRDGSGKPLLANQLLEQLVGLDGDSGRTAQESYVRWFKGLAKINGRGFPDKWHLDICDDLVRQILPACAPSPAPCCVHLANRAHLAADSSCCTRHVPGP